MRRTVVLALVVAVLGKIAVAEGYLDSASGWVLPCSGESAAVWWTSSGWKIGPEKAPPTQKAEAMRICTAANEAEAAQLVIRPAAAMKGLTATASALRGPGGALSKDAVEILAVRYVNVTTPTDRSSTAGLWPDPLPPLDGRADLEAGRNYVLWVRVKPPAGTKAGLYTGSIRLGAAGYSAEAPLAVEVFGFELADRMTCVTAFGFSPGNVFSYQKISSNSDKRAVLEKYWANFSAHHISPYNFAPLDGIKTSWPDIKPNKSKWTGGTNVRNETHSGDWALAINDDSTTFNSTAVYEPLIEIPPDGLRLSFWYRTPMPEQSFLVTLNHYDDKGEWISGGNNDIGIDGDGKWRKFDRIIKKFPKNAKSVRLNLRATMWTDAGENIGLVWFDEVSLKDAGTGREFVEGGEFGPPPLPPFDPDKLQVKIDFSAWDKAMSRGIDHYKFNSFRLGIPGMGGGTFHARSNPQLLGFGEDSPHYQTMFNSYCRQIQEHLRARGWLDEAYVYWFDEPAPRDYEFVNRGFARLKKAAPDINRMLTEQVEEGLIGGPNIWCPVSNNYEHESAQQRREQGDKFWWYVCCGPKAPYCTLFIDHPGTELRVWLWQTWQRGINGILVWQTNYWTSSAAYPDRPQNPYADPMGWRSGYSTPKGEKRPWGNGDGRFIYPPVAAADANPGKPILEGPVDSIRWEMLRDGVEDYEYMVILRRLLDEKKGKLTADRRRLYGELLEVPAEVTTDMTTFTKDPAPIEKRRIEIARAIEQLSSL